MGKLQEEERGLRRKFDVIKDHLDDEFKLLATVLKSEVIVHITAAEVAAYRASGGTELNLMALQTGAKPDDSTARGILAAGQPLLRMRSARQDAAAAAPLIERAITGDAAAAEELKRRFGGRADDPYFAYELTSRLGPEKIVAMGAQAALLSVGGSVDDPDIAGRAWACMFLGRSNAAASESRRYTDTPPTYRAQVASWRQKVYLPGLVEQGKQTFTLDGAGNPVPGSSGELSGFQIIGNLVGLGAEAGVSPGPEFMTVVGGGLAKWEYGILTDSKSDHGLSRDMTPPNLPGVGRAAAADPTSGFLAAGKIDRPAAQALLMIPVTTEEPVRRYGEVLLMPMRYTQQGYTNLDGGKAIAEVFTVADCDDRDRAGSQLASDFLNGYADGLTKDSPSLGKAVTQVGGSPYGEKFPAFRLTAAKMMAHHIADYQGMGTIGKMASGVNPIREPGEGDESYADRMKTTDEELRETYTHMVHRGGPDEPWTLGILDYQQTAVIVAEIGMDGPLSAANSPREASAGQILLTAQLAHRDQVLLQLMRENSHSELAATGATGTASYFLTSLAKGRIAMGAAEDDVARETQAFIKPFIDAPIKNPIADAVASPVVDRGRDWLLEKMLPTDQAAQEAKGAKIEEDFAQKYFDSRTYEAIIWRENEKTDSALVKWAKEYDENSESAAPNTPKFIGADGKMISYFKM
ncbi:MAG: hypothetical protein ACRC0L_00120, partial [Angustibacter sp.]